MRKVPLLLVVTAAMAGGLLSPSWAQAAPAPTVVSITFDDGYADNAPALDAMKSRGMKGTIYINSQRVGFDSNFLSRAKVKTYYQSGFEVAGHSLDHEDLTTLTPDAARANICADRTNLINLGYRVTSFAYPFGSYDAAVKQAVRDCGYNSARIISDLKSPETCFDCDVAESIPPVDPYEIRTPVSIRSTFSLTQVQTLVTQAEDDGGGWVPLVLHHICDTCGDNSMALADFTAFIDWLQARPSTTTVKTVDEVIGGSMQPPPDGEDPVPEPDMVIIGSRTHAIDGVNARRTTDSMILYTRVSGASTKTNAYGTEVALAGGVVTKVETGVGNMAIPSGGSVLSGHGESAAWLRTYAPIGTAVTIHDSADPPPTTPPPVEHPTTNVTIGSAGHAVNGVDIYRASGFLVVYTSERGATTGTNEYGFEAKVVGGVVTKIENGVGDMAIPTDGYVLSGHGEARTWLKANAVMGAVVES